MAYLAQVVNAGQIAEHAVIAHPRDVVVSDPIEAGARGSVGPAPARRDPGVCSQS